ncbi:MAG: glycosyltransferase family 2 protein [bacterium]
MLLFLSVICILHTYILYLLIIIVLSKFAKKVKQDESFLPSVSLLIVAYNEEKIIQRKIENSLALDYPRLEIIIASDGSTDKTNEIALRYKEKGIILKGLPRTGKVSALNNTIPDAKGEIIVLSDANVMYKEDAIRRLICNFADSSVGGVSGNVMILKTEKATYGKGEGIYSRYEKYIQKKESQISSVIGVDGGMYAICKRLFRPIPKYIILDDFANVVNIIKQGYRVIYEEKAIGYEDTAEGSKGEFIRRIRISGGGFQMLLKNTLGIFLFNHPFLLFQFISHKLFRWFTPFFLLIFLITNLILINACSIYKICLFFQLLFYLFALIGWLFKLRVKPFSIPFYFCLIQVASLIGFYKALTGKLRVTWTKGR